MLAPAVMGFPFPHGIVSEFSIVPTRVSGSLSPAVVALDGTVLARSPEKAAGLELNGRPVTIRKGRTQPFFFETEETTLSFIVRRSDHTRIPLASITFPVLTTVKVEGNEIVVSYQGDVHQAYFDRANMKIEKGRLSFRLSSKPSRASRSLHLIELLARPGGPSRLYQLRLREP